MGGITSTTVEKTMQLGYKGLGVLGGIWHAEHPVKAYLDIKNTREQLQKQRN